MEYKQGESWQHIILRYLLLCISDRQILDHLNKAFTNTYLLYLLDFTSVSPSSLGLGGCLWEDISSGTSI